MIGGFLARLAAWIAELVASLRPRPTILVARALSQHLIQGVYVVPTAIIEQDGLVATFTGLAPGEYRATAVRLDEAGLPLGEPVATIFAVADETPVTIDIANGLTVNLQAD